MSSQHNVVLLRLIRMNIERNRNAWIGLAVVLLFAVAAFSAFGFGMMGHEPMMGYGGRPFFGAGPWFWGFGLIGLVLRVAIWGGLIMLGVSFFRRMSGRSAMRGDHWDSSSLEILRQRYAAGEISREQFEEMRRVLEPTAG